MKLNASQIETIEYYLLTWELKYKDFYDEILDHYCTDIENQMKTGLSFDDAFDKTNQVFSKYYYAQIIRFQEPIHHYGPKAFEAEYVDGYRKTFKTKLKNHFLNIFRTYQIGFLGALVMFFYYCFSNNVFFINNTFNGNTLFTVNHNIFSDAKRTKQTRLCLELEIAIFYSRKRHQSKAKQTI